MSRGSSLSKAAKWLGDGLSRGARPQRVTYTGHTTAQDGSIVDLPSVRFKYVAGYAVRYADRGTDNFNPNWGGGVELTLSGGIVH